MRRAHLHAVAAMMMLAGCGERATTRVNLAPGSPFQLADSLRDGGRFLAAAPLYRALRDSLEQAGDSANLWRAQLWWAYMLYRTNRPDSSVPEIERAMRLANGNTIREGWTRWVRCGRYSRVGQSDSAIDECAHALRLAETTGDHELEARIRHQLGTIHSRLGHYRISVDETERTLALHRRFNHSAQRLMGTYNSMGIEYAAVGRLGEAEEMYQEGLRLADSLGNTWTEFHLQSNLAYLRRYTGDLEEALQLMIASLRGAAELADTQGMVYAHNSLAEFYLSAGNRQEARRHLEQSLAMNQRVAAIYRVIALADLGALEAEESPGSAAERTLITALGMADSAGFGLQRVTIRASLAHLAVKMGRASAALRWADAAVAIADSMAAPDAQIQALEARAAALEANRRSSASDGYLEGIELLESWRGRLTLGDLRMGVAEPRWEIYEGAIRTLLAGGRTEEALAVAERARARLLLEVMAGRDASRPAASPLDDVRRQLRARFEERAAVSRPDEQTALDRELVQLTDSLAKLEAAESARHPVPASVGRIRSELLVPGRALLSFFWGDRAVYAWWATRDAVRWARLGSADSLAALTEFLSRTIARPGSGASWKPPATQAYERFIAPLDPAPVEEVLVVADGPLAHVPLEVLIPVEGGLPWGATTRFIYGPSATVLLSLAQAPETAGWPRSVLALGNPSAAARGRERPAERGHDANAVPVPLPYAAAEARAVHALFREGGADLLLGKQATPERWLALEPSRYRYLHFAAHARVSDRRPEETHLVLSGGTLDLATIRGLRLHSELVTLSACETALGRRVRGEGVIGLSHAFLAAGARATLVTLWRIADQSAAEFMKDFYQELHAGSPAAEALLAVRRRWIQAGSARDHPSQWAPFVLVGGI